jgi:hypothetical protein
MILTQIGFPWESPSGIDFTKSLIPFGDEDILAHAIVPGNLVPPVLRCFAVTLHPVDEEMNETRRHYAVTV